MKTEWIERKRDNLLIVRIGDRKVIEEVDGKPVTRTEPVFREFAWGKDVKQAAAERESLLIIEAEAEA